MANLTLTQLMEKYNYEMKRGQINLITAPCGSGKTYYMLNTIMMKEKQVIYVCDTTALKDCIVQDFAQVYAETFGVDIETILQRTNDNHYYLKLNHMNEDYHHMFMTYSAFGQWMKHDVLYALINNTIIFDEAHNLLEYQDNFNKLTDDEYTDGEYTHAVNTLFDNYFLENNTVIALSATPEQLTYQDKVVDIIGDTVKELKCYKQKYHINYSGSLTELLTTIHYKKVVVFTSGSVDSMIKKRDELKQADIKVECLFSKNNKQYQFNPFQNQVYTELVENRNISLVDVLIINSAYESGINIDDVDIDVFIYDAKMEHQKNYQKIQSLGRIRHDIDRMYIRTYAHDIKKSDKDLMKQVNANQNRINLLESNLDKKLTSKEFKALCVELDFRNDKREIIKLPIEQIESLGYKIQKPTNSKRYYMITK